MEIAEINWDFICFSETRAADNDVLLTGGHRLLSSLHQQQFSGVALLIHARWADNIIGYNRFSSRVMYVDLQIERQLYRIISTYFPHAGYGYEDFTSILRDLRTVILEARCRKARVIIGGDFNTEHGRGQRGAELLNFVCEHGMAFCNVQDDEEWSSAWTFRSALGRLRRLDYVLADECLNVRSASAIDHLDMGSDHRAVQCCVDFPIPVAPRWRERPLTHKQIDWNTYRSSLSDSTLYFASLAEMETFVVQRARDARIRHTRGFIVDSMASDHLRRLRTLRRRSTQAHERRDLSKQIRRLTRKNDRVKRAQRINNVLQEFSDLGRLAWVRRPSSRPSKRGPDLTKCAELLESVYRSDLRDNVVHPRELAITMPIPSFTIDEVKKAVATMAKRKTCDKNGVLLEMFYHGGTFYLLA